MRCYNGCPDSKLQAWIDEQSRLHKELERLDVRATYFPSEERWMIFDRNHQSVGEFHATLDGAVHAYKMKRRMDDGL